MLSFDSGSSTAVNSAKAMRECVEKAIGDHGDRARLVLLHTTMGHNFAQLLAAAREACPEADICGCTGSGIAGTEGVSEKLRALAVLTVTGDEVAVESVSGIDIGNSERLARDCAQALAGKLEGVNMVGAFGPGLHVCADDIIRGIEAVFGSDVPIFGALAGDNAKLARTLQFHNDEIYEDGLFLVGFADDSLEMVQEAHHGSLPVGGQTFTVTRSEHSRIDELDGKPAWPALMEHLELDVGTEPGAAIALTGMGILLDEDEQRAYDNAYLLRAPFHVSDDRKSFYMLASCPVGTKLVMMRRDEDYIFAGVEGLNARLQAKLAGRRPVVVFQADCMARGRMTVDQISKDEIIKKIQEPVCGDEVVPWLGVYGFAEFAMLAGHNIFHHFTTSLSAVVKRQ